MEQWCSNTQQEALGILHGLEKFHHYCFAKAANVIKDHKPLVAVVGKDITTLSQWLQHIILHIHQYSVCILYKPGLDVYIGDWLSKHSHTEGKNQKVAGMNINVHTLSTELDITVCTSIEDIRNAMSMMKNCRCYRHT